MRAFALIPLSACALAGTLDLAVLDEKGAPVAARLKLRDGQGMLVRLAEPLLPIHPRYPELGVVLPGKGKIRTPPGPHTAIVERGTEYRPEEIAVEGDVTRTVR
ncbi:MAG: hypothetical protein HYR60_11185, partial [Acidobacteria bacterium]|nr:hypothetical protein [Acidobacteriota bacterium]